MRTGLPNPDLRRIAGSIGNSLHFSPNSVYQDLFRGNGEAVARKISCAICRIQACPFDYIVKAEDRPTR